MPSTNANTVSRFLRANGFRRSIQRDTRTISQGYTVTSRTGRTVVQFELGTIMGPSNQEQRRETVAYAMNRMERVLSQHYTVIMFEPAEGLGYTLTVLPRTA